MKLSDEYIELLNAVINMSNNLENFQNGDQCFIVVSNLQEEAKIILQYYKEKRHIFNKLKRKNFLMSDTFTIDQLKDISFCNNFCISYIQKNTYAYNYYKKYGEILNYD